jgi:hypothetical protein
MIALAIDAVANSDVDGTFFLCGDGAVKAQCVDVAVTY